MEIFVGKWGIKLVRMPGKSEYFFLFLNSSIIFMWLAIHSRTYLKGALKLVFIYCECIHIP